MDDPKHKRTTNFPSEIKEGGDRADIGVCPHFGGTITEKNIEYHNAVMLCTDGQ